MIAEVIINRVAKDLNRVFDYVVPTDMESTIKVGARVFVPFGNKNTATESFVIGLKEKSEFANKKVIKIEDYALTEENINLAKLMAKRYFCNISECIKLMLPPGEKTTNLENRIKDKKANFIYLKKSIDEIEIEIEYGKLKNQKHIKALRFLEENDGIYIGDFEILADISRAIIKTLEKNGYIEIIEKKIERNPFEGRVIKRDKPLKLTEEQQKAFDTIKNSGFNSFLIYGVTGSGKTECFMLPIINELIKEVNDGNLEPGVRAIF